MPDAQDLHVAGIGQFIDDDVGRHGNKFTGANNPSGPTPARKDGQAIARQNKFTGDLAGRYGVFFGDMANETENIGVGRRMPNDRHNNRGSGGGVSK